MGIVALKKDFETRIIRGGRFVSNFTPAIVKIGLCQIKYWQNINDTPINKLYIYI